MCVDDPHSRHCLGGPGEADLGVGGKVGDLLSGVWKVSVKDTFLLALNTIVKDFKNYGLN